MTKKLIFLCKTPAHIIVQFLNQNCRLFNYGHTERETFLSAISKEHSFKGSTVQSLKS